MITLDIKLCDNKKRFEYEIWSFDLKKPKFPKKFQIGLFRFN